MLHVSSLRRSLSLAYRRQLAPKRRVARWLVLCAPLAGCALDDRRLVPGGLIEALTPDGGAENGAAPLEPPGPGTLVAAMTEINLGVLEVGGPGASYTWVVTGAGPGPAEGLALDVEFSTDLEVRDGCGRRLDAGQSCEIEITYTPQYPRLFQSTLRLTNGAEADVALAVTARSQARINVERVGNGSVRSTPAGIDCGATCSGLFGAGSLLLDVEPEPGWLFAGIDGAECEVLDDTCSLDVSSSLTLTARFAEIENNLVFVSSEAFPATLGSAAAYDVECNRLATEAGFNTPTGDGFIAATSDAAGAFPARLRPGVRGWIRRDGKPVADTVEALLLGTIYHPVSFDERGGFESGRVLTGTRADGTLGDNCVDWTDASGNVTAGFAAGGPGYWTDATPAQSCADLLPVLCLGNTSTAPLAPTVGSGKRIWRTVATYMPGGSSPDGACALEMPVGVSAARALVAYADRPASAVLDAASNYVRVDGQLVGSGQQLIDAGNEAAWTGAFRAGRVIQTGIWQAADGSYSPGDVGRVWSGALDLSSPASAATNCSDWSSTTGTGLAGVFQLAQRDFWVADGAASCATPAHLYCVEP
jgi:hypothetical protein